MRIGVDLGGTKVEAIALGSTGDELGRRRVPTPSNGYEAIVTAVRDLVVNLEAEVGATGTVGVGTPGAISPFSGLLRNSNSQALNQQPLDRDLATALGREIRMTNDANCFALSEAVDGAGTGHETVFGVIIGTGVGGGVAIGGRALRGPNAIAGEWGHNELPGQAEHLDCYCGRVNCVEKFLSGPGMSADYHRRTGRELAAVEIVDRVGSDSAARDVLETYTDRLARGLAAVINILDPDVIVLGGGMSNIEPLYEGVPERWGKWVFSDEVATPLVKNHHGDSSGVRGAAWLWD